MAKNKLNFPAVLMHTIDGVQYRVNGTLVSINEAAGTCSMEFAGYPVQHDIPISSVYLTEGFIDKIKEYGKAALQGIKKLIKAVGGFLFPPTEDGEPDYRFANSPVNLAVAATTGQLNANIHFYPADGMNGILADNGVNPVVSETEFGDYAAHDDAQMCTKFWTRVMREYAKQTDSTITEAIETVNKKYYQAAKPLNEAPIISLGNEVPDQYGREVSTREIVGMIRSNIRQQLTPINGKHSKTKPLFIWGAPGIGKTALIRQAFDNFRKEKNIDLNLMEISCAGLHKDDFALPKNIDNYLGDNISIDVVKYWLPVYYPPVDPEALKDVDDFFNSGKFNYFASSLPYLKDENGQRIPDGKGGFKRDYSKVHTYDGGIVFLDEFMRMDPGAQQVWMNLINEQVYNGMALATKWGFICASNRAHDVGLQEEEFFFEAARAGRFEQVLYVPKLSEWLEWARSKDAVTGRQMVDNMICNFIEQIGESVWYDAILLGSRDTQLTAAELATKNAHMMVTKENDLQIDDFAQIMSHKGTWQPRSWKESINDKIMKTLEYEIFDNHPDLYQSIFTKDGNIDNTALAHALDQLSDKEWDYWAYPLQDKIDSNYLLDRYAFFFKWLKYCIANAVGGEDTAPVQEWDVYYQYKSTFTRDEVQSIWNTGKMKDPEKAADDDLYFQNITEYKGTKFSKWKFSTATIVQVVNLLLAEYPGGDAALEAQVKKDLETFDATPMPSDKDFDKLYKEYAEKYAIKLMPSDGGKPIDEQFLFEDDVKGSSDKVTRERALTIIHTLQSSEVARKMANVAMYIAKICMQVHSNTVVEQHRNELISFLRQHLSSALFNKVYALGGDWKDVQKFRDDASKLVPLNNVFFMPAFNIFVNAKHRALLVAKGKR